MDVGSSSGRISSGNDGCSGPVSVAAIGVDRGELLVSAFRNSWPLDRSGILEFNTGDF